MLIKSMEKNMPTEYKFKNAIVRIHGTVNEEVVKAAAIKFLKEAERQLAKQGKEAASSHKMDELPKCSVE